MLKILITFTCSINIVMMFNLLKQELFERGHYKKPPLQEKNYILAHHHSYLALPLTGVVVSERVGVIISDLAGRFVAISDRRAEPFLTPCDW